MSIQEQQKEERAAWERFILDRSSVNRSALIMRYTSFANMLAASMYAKRQVDEVEFEEFRQYALVGLIESIDRYEPLLSKASFQTYASHRIKGAILNGIEKYCERQQQIFMRTRLRKERVKALLHEASTEPMTFDRLVETAIGIAIGYMLDDSGMYQSEEGAYEQNAYKRRELADLVRVVKELVATLPEQEQGVIKGHYFQQMQFDEIAESMQLTKGRISQIHHQALRLLQEHYDKLKLLRTDL